MKRSVLLFFSILLLLVNVLNAQQHSDEKKGWYWYERIKTEEKSKKDVVETKEVKEDKKLDITKYSFDELWNMEPKQFAQLIEEVKNNAIKTLKPEDAVAYLILQDIALRKSEAFANVASYVVQRHPELGQVLTPTNAPGVRERLSMISEETTNVLESYRNKYGLILFTQVGCNYCDAQKKIFAVHGDKLVLDMVEVDINQNSILPRKFNINITPSIILVERDSNRFFPISSGIEDIETIRSRIYRAIKYLENDSSPDNFLKMNNDYKYDPLMDKNRYNQFMTELRRYYYEKQ